MAELLRFTGLTDPRQAVRSLRSIKAVAALIMLAFVLLAAVTTIVSSPHSASIQKDHWHRHKGHHQEPLVTDTDTVKPVVTNRGGYHGDISERNEAIVPQYARCMPELRTVKLRKSNDLSFHYTPSCTRVERCGGCCSQEEFLSCQPTEIEIMKYKVQVRKYVGNGKYANMGHEIIRVERHVKCKCGCIVKPGDCNALQEYIKQECKCACTNHDEKQKCLEDDSKKKFWDSVDCSCKCLNPKECSTGYTFNKHTCSCEPEQRQRIPVDSRSGTRRREP